MSYKRHRSKRTVTGGAVVNMDLKQRERWRPGRQKWQPEVDIFSLSLLSLDKYLHQELKQFIQIRCVRQKRSIKRDIELLVATVYSWRPGRQRARCLLRWA